MDERIQKALDYHHKGYNCCQAVACAYCDAVGIDESTMFKMSEGFGFGMGNMKNVCGAVSGAIILAGLKNSTGKLENPPTKADTYRLSKSITKDFEDLNGSVICKDIKGIDTGKILRTCDGCIEDAARIAEKVLFNKQ